MLEIKGLHASYGKFDVLKGVSLTIEKGQIVALIGPNGAGKSTVFRSIFALPGLKKRGEIFFKNEELSSLKPHEILDRGICFVMQRRSVFPHLSVRENLELGAYTRDDTEDIEKDIEWVYGLFPILSERKDEKGGILSGGEQRMLEIARVLLLHPELLMLDEPTLGLSPLVIELVFEKILEIRDHGTTIMVVEQNAKKALSVSDYAYVLVDGQNYMDGPAKDVREDPEIVKAFLGGK